MCRRITIDLIWDDEDDDTTGEIFVDRERHTLNSYLEEALIRQFYQFNYGPGDIQISVHSLNVETHEAQD